MSLPSSGMGWIQYLTERLDSAPPEQVLRLSRALMSVLLLGKFQGSDLFSSDEDKQPIIDKSELKFLQSAEISYGLSKTKKPTLEDRIWFAKGLRAIVLKKVELKEIVPKEFQKFESLEAFGTPLELWEDDSNECLILAKRFRDEEFNLDVKQTHAFIILWAFWALSSHQWLNLKIDLLNFKAVLKSENCSNLSAFVNK
jgi:hypothetical protein